MRSGATGPSRTTSPSRTTVTAMGLPSDLAMRSGMSDGLVTERPPIVTKRSPLFTSAFVSVGGTLTSFSVPAAIATLAYDINDSKRLVVGYYIDGSGILHGHFRDADGELHFPIDPPGSVATILFGLNDRNWVVGRYADTSGVTHGLFFVPPNNFFTFDFPGSTFTSLNGISSQGNITGRYVDASGIAHGFIARVRGTPPTKAAGPEMKANHAMPAR